MIEEKGLEYAQQRMLRIAEIDIQIKQCRDFQISAKKAHDNTLDKIWANKINELRAEKHQLHESNEYPRMRAFVQVIKTYLTPQQYKEAWERVDKIIELAENINH